MTWTDVAVLVTGGVLGGLTGSIAGLASVATYPVLLAVGLPPVAANVTNTVALIFNGVGSVWGSRPELRGQGRQVRRLVPAAAAGGAVGAVLLLSTPAEQFERIVPFLLGLASIAILWPRRRTVDRTAPSATTALTSIAVLLISIYGGYFGAAAGVLLLALFLHTDGETLAHANAAKNVVLGVANAVAAVGFAVFAPVSWAAVIPLGVGCLIGSRIGPVVVRHAPTMAMRVLIGAAGLALAVVLGVEAFRPG